MTFDFVAPAKVSDWVEGRCEVVGSEGSNAGVEPVQDRDDATRDGGVCHDGGGHGTAIPVDERIDSRPLGGVGARTVRDDEHAPERVLVELESFDVVAPVRIGRWPRAVDEQGQVAQELE